MQLKHLYSVLMLAGCIPFVIAAAMPYFESHELPVFGNVHRSIAFYSLALVSFMAGIQWGSALTSHGSDQPSHKKPINTHLALIVSNAFVIAPWFVLCSVGVGVGFYFLIALSFILMAMNDYRLAERRINSNHYCRLRVVATAIIVPCLISLAFTV